MGIRPAPYATAAALGAVLGAYSFSFTPVHADASGPGTVYLHTDHLGSVTALSHGTGTIFSRTSYSPGGVPRATPAAGRETSAARFTGKQWEPRAGLYYFDARWHDPFLGRFLSPDAAGQVSSPYAYAGATPLQRIDPDGNWYTDIDEILAVAAHNPGISLDTPAHRLRALYMARIQAVASRRYYEGLAGSYRRQRSNIKIRISRAKRRASAARDRALDPYRRLSNLARQARDEMDLWDGPVNRNSNRHVYQINRGRKLFASQAGNIIASGLSLPEAWVWVRNQLKRLDNEALKGWGTFTHPHYPVIFDPDLVEAKIAAARALLSSFIMDTSSEKYILKNLVRRTDEDRALSELIDERDQLRVLYRQARRNARKIDGKVIPELDARIGAQRQRLGLSPN